MRNFYIVSLLVLIISFFTGCTKDKPSIQDGIYKGIFTVTYSTGTQTGPVTIELKNRTYTSSSNANRIPSGGSGTFQVTKNKMIFSDDKMWTADFDWNLILNGEYEAVFDGKKLKLSASRSSVGQYQYELEKQ
ncbi:MAG: hypothetical protein ACK5BO_12355 [Bacteroidota bacterium]|jgi:hypothetical protein